MYDLLTCRTRRRIGALALLTVAALSACTSTTTSGTPTTADPATTSVPAAAPVDPLALDPGRYPTTAAAPAGLAGSETEGRVIEGRRMAGALVGPWQIDPTLIRSGGATAALITEPTELGAVIYPSTTYRTPNLTALLVAFSAERWAAAPANLTRLRNTLLRFPDDATAAGVAAGLTDGTLTMLVSTDSGGPIPIEPIRAVPVPTAPDVSAAVLSFREGTQTVHEAILITARGPFVLVHSARTTDNPDAAVALVADTLEAQRARLDAFDPTPVDQLSTLPRDPTGLFARTIPATDPTALASGTYDPAGALHLQADPLVAERAFDDGGVDVVSNGLTTVYQSTDPSAAAAVAEQLYADLPDASPVPGLPASRCASTADGAGALVRYQCIATEGRYALTASSRDLATAHQQIAAQYRMISGS